MRSLRLLQPGRITQPGILAQVHPSRCTACGSCAAVCPYGARYFEADKPYALVDPSACQGCGACAAACPNGASSMTEAEIGTLYAIEAALR
jgi:heterodisulfide reductase subunit A